MALSDQIKPISYLKANTAKMFKDLQEKGDPFYITQNGEAKAVLLDIKEYEQTQENLALLRIVAMG